MQIPWKRWVTKEKVLHGHLNDLSDLINQPPFIRVKKNTTQSITVGTTWVPIIWNAEDSPDPYNMWSAGNPTVITIPYTGYYNLYCKTDWVPMTVQDFWTRALKNNTTEICRVSGFGTDSSWAPQMQCYGPCIPFVAGDTVIWQLRHEDTVARNIQAANDGTWAVVQFYCAGVLGT